MITKNILLRVSSLFHSAVLIKDVIGRGILRVKTGDIIFRKMETVHVAWKHALMTEIV